MGLSADVGPGPVALDTAIFIYFIQEHPRFLPHVLPLFEEADSGTRELVTSALTLLEVLVIPFRIADVQLADRYESLLTRGRGVRLVQLTRHQLRAAAQLRAAIRIKTPDALQVAAALGAECRTFVTNNRDMPPVPGLRIIQLGSYVNAH